MSQFLLTNWEFIEMNPKIQNIDKNQSEQIRKSFKRKLYHSWVNKELLDFLPSIEKKAELALRNQCEQTIQETTKFMWILQDNME